MTNIDHKEELNPNKSSNNTLMSISDKILYLPANHDTDRPILAAISGNKRTLIVDAGNSSDHAKLFLKELSNYRIIQPEFVAITHWHWDHIFGIHEINLPTIAHIKTKDEIEEMLNYEWDDKALDKRVEEGIEIPFCADMIKKEFATNRDDIKIEIPDILFENKMIIDLGELTCVIENVGGDHSEDSTIVFVKEEKILFLGDCLAPDLYCKKWKYSIEKLLLLLDKIESYDADIYIESHGKPTTKTEFKKEIDELRKVALIIQNRGTNQNEITADLTKELNRELNEDDLETIEYFLNGLEEENKVISDKIKEDTSMKIIAHIRTDLATKFGIPRQSGLVNALKGVIVFEPQYRNPDALRGLEEFSHLWIIWKFSESIRDTWFPTVRPPRLGGNKKIGVFATRSPFRPNAIGLSSVKLDGIEIHKEMGPILHVSGIDLLDNTPIYDIKPYLPYTDSHTEAVGGFAESVKDHKLEVEFADELLSLIPKEKREAILGVLGQDPRPSYQNDPNRIYGLEFAGFDIRFTVRDTVLSVCMVVPIE